MSKQFAAMFTGQGAQFEGMGKELFDEYEKVKEIFKIGSEITGMDIENICFNTPDADLSKTINAQVAIFTLSCATLEVLKQKGFNPSCCCGFSLGEIAAYYGAGVFSLEDGFKIIKKRAQVMQSAAESSNGAMYAIVGLENEIIEKICDETDGYVIAVNYNCPLQTVIAGDIAACEKAADALIAAGAKKAVRLSVGGAFHSKFMADASSEFHDFLKSIEFSNPKIPLYTNVTGEMLLEDGDLRLNLAHQMANPVLWEKEMNNIINSGIITFVEIGAGRTLSGLMRKINRDAVTSSIRTPKDIAELISIIQ